MEFLRVIDSHTGGEPTRIVYSGGPDLGPGPLARRREVFRREWDHYRSAIVEEPRGSEIIVGGLLTPPENAGCSAGVVFFNNVGYLGMCGHGLIGLAASLVHLKQLTAGKHSIDTPVGVVTVTLHPDGRVSFANVPAHRFRRAVTIDVPRIGKVTGDIAWGGNWFFLVENHGQILEPSRVDALLHYTRQIRQTLESTGITGKAGAAIDHIELCSPSPHSGLQGRNFVLCPGGQYDRSPCGTGTSARLACLHAEGRLGIGELWQQESITGSVFEAFLRLEGSSLIPVITGKAFVTAESTLVLDTEDPACWGLRNLKSH